MTVLIWSLFIRLVRRFALACLGPYYTFLAVLIFAAQGHAQDVDLTVLDTASPRAEIKVLWKGPDASGDFLAIAEPNEPATSYIAYARTKDGSPAVLTAPGAGKYEVRYISAVGLEVLARVPLNVGAQSAKRTITAPSEVGAGADLVVSVSDTGEPADYITIVGTGAPDIAVGPYARLRGEVEVSLAAPETAGSYEIRQIRASGQTVLARVPLTVRGQVEPAVSEANRPGEPAVPAATGINAATTTVTLQQASEVAPSLLALLAVDRMRSFGVVWSGPGVEGDMIGIRANGASVRDLGDQPVTVGPLLRFTAPDTPGDYEIVYIDNASGAVLARRKLEVR